MTNKGKRVKVHYRGTLDDGTQFDSSYDRGEPLEFICGSGQMIAGFDEAVLTMEVGSKVSVHLEAAKAYGERDENLVVSFPAEQVPDMGSITVGDRVMLRGPQNMPLPATVTQITPKSVTVDANHELAGKALNFDIELVEVEG